MLQRHTKVTCSMLVFHQLNCPHGSFGINRVYRNSSVPKHENSAKATKRLRRLSSRVRRRRFLLVLPPPSFASLHRVAGNLFSVKAFDGTFSGGFCRMICVMTHVARTCS